MGVRKVVAVWIGLAVFLLLTPWHSRADVVPSVTYLEAHASNPWVTMALAATGQSPDITYLKTLARSSTTDYESSILAITAVGKDPRTFIGDDLIAKLESFSKEHQLGDIELLNDDIFGILAFSSSGMAPSNQYISDSVQYLRSHQLPNGGWGYATTAGSDTNTTAAAIMALRSAGVPATDPAILTAISYLKSTQNPDGGYPYDPSQAYSSASDSSSDAWVISALTSVGEHPSLTHLTSLIDPQGFAHYTSLEDAPTSFTPVSTAYALIALSGKFFPVGIWSAPQASEASVTYRIAGSTSILCAGQIQVRTALDVVKKASTECGFTYNIKDTSFGAYVQQIGNDAAAGSSGWLYAVNGKEPSIGAGDYLLASGDTVIWFFGPFDAPVPSIPPSSGIDLSASVLPATTPRDALGFEIDTKALAFGSLKPGSIGTAQFTVRNIGTQPFRLVGSVTGNEIFRNYLQLGNLLWREYSMTVAPAATSTIQAKLPVPATYAQAGDKSGILTFWITTTN